MNLQYLINTPKLDNVIVQNGTNEVIGTLCITGHHLIVASRNSEDVQELWVSVIYCLSKTSNN
jgi:hypothetical protein